MKMSLLMLFAFAGCLVSAIHAEESVVPATELKFPQESSSELTTAGWNAFKANNYDHTIAYAKECIKRYEQDAVAMQKELKEPVPSSDREAVSSKWALNDVGTCYFMLGQALEKQGKSAEALKAYKHLSEKLAFAQCWDPQGWFWKPADAAKKQIKTIEFELLDQSEGE